VSFGIAGNGFGLGDGCEALDCAVGNLRQTRVIRCIIFFF